LDVLDSLNLRSYSNIPRLAEKIRSLSSQHETTIRISTPQSGSSNKALQATTSRLVVMCPGCEPDWNSTEIQSLFDSIGRLPHLHELQLKCLGHVDVALPLRLLTLLLRKSLRLQSLDLDDVALSISSVEEVEDFEKTIKQRQASQHQISLSKFRLFGCWSDHTEELMQSSPFSSLNPFWSALSMIERVEVDAIEVGLLGSISALTLQHLITSPSLKALCLKRVALNCHCVEIMASPLRTNTTLRDLSVDVHTDKDAVHALADALRDNNHLEKLNLNMSPIRNHDSGLLQVLAQALSCKDCTLKCLTIQAAAIPILDETAHAFVKMMESNFELQHLQLSSYQGKWKPIYQYYATLNQHGRGYFHRHYSSLSKRKLVEKALVPAVDSASLLYYFLHMNPTLWACPRSTSAQRAKVLS